MKKKWLLVIIAIVAALILEVIQINSQPGTHSQTLLNRQRESIYPNQIIENVGYSTSENGIKAEKQDPQLYFLTAGLGSFSQIDFNFSSPVEKPIQIQVFFPGADGYTEENSVVSCCPKGEDYCLIQIPLAEYDVLRIDMDSEEYTIPLASIGIGEYPQVINTQRQGMHPIRIIIMAVLLFVVLFWMSWCKTWTGIKTAILRGIRNIQEDRKRAILYVMAFPAGIGIVIFLFWVFHCIFGKELMTAPKLVFAGFVGFFTTFMLVFRKTLKTQPEYIFLVLILCVGFLYSYYVPHTGLNSWDEDFHYVQALKTSYVDSVIMTPQDEITAARSIPASYDLNGGIQSLHNRQDLLYQSGGVTEENTFVHITAIPELFNGIGLFLGRALGLRYYMIHFLGRFTGLIMYAILGFLAVRKLNSGKLIVVVALMIPTEVFLASSYNYDSYLTGFTTVGLCYYMALWQDRDKKVTLKDMLIMIGSIAFGCMIKPIYIPLLWILCLLPRKKFTSKRTHIWFITLIVVATGLVIFSYIIPTFARGDSSLEAYTDVRGGSEVSAAKQALFILKHPFHYARVMWDYLINSYFNLARIGEMLTNYPYNAILPNQYLYFVLMLAVAFTDKNEYDRELVHHLWVHIWPILVSLGITVMIMTSMYLVFTPVGADWIAGSQFRYLIPLILPILFHIGSGMIENKMDRTWYNGIIFGVTAFVAFACVYNGYICHYY